VPSFAKPPRPVSATVEPCRGAYVERKKNGRSPNEVFLNPSRHKFRVLTHRSFFARLWIPLPSLRDLLRLLIRPIHQELRTKRTCFCLLFRL